VIEDETFLREEILDWLHYEGYEAFGAENGRLGIQRAERELPDLIICDISMPELDGYGVLLNIHARPETAAIPFIFITAKASRRDIRRGMELGADDYIAKPFTNVELFQAINTRLHKKHRQEEEHQRQIDHLQSTLTRVQEQKLLQSKLLGMFSHDFDGPVSSILITSSLLRQQMQGVKLPAWQEHLDRIDASARLLQQMREDVLVVAEIESGNLHFVPEPCQPHVMIERLLAVFKAIHGEKHQVHLEDQCEETIALDLRLFRQIAANLISNAMKYSARSTEIRITLQSTSRQFSFTVEDQGIGIPAAEQTSLFEPFQRGSNAAHTSGSGLGLAIVKQAVELHRGTIQIKSAVGSGTSVSVTLPLMTNGANH